MTTRNDVQKHRRDQDLHMLNHPDIWPAFPFLPVKRYVEGRLDCRVIWAGTPLKVVEASLFALPGTEEEFTTLPHIDYASTEAIVSDGWTVD